MLTKLTAAEVSQKLHDKEVSVREVTEAYLDRIDRLDDRYSSYLTVTRDEALVAAEKAQKLIDAGEASRLTGVPIAIKDNISTKDILTTCASRVLENYVPPYDATVMSKIHGNGLVLLGKTNLDEFAMGSSTETSAFKVSTNPWDLSRSPGGSSGGSATAVVGRLAPLALGSDTGGSIRFPAALCGIVGFKPTYGRCSRFGLVAFGSSLDQIGPMTRTVEDTALLAEVITGHDPLDSTSLPLPPISSKDIKNGSLKGLKFALPKELFSGNAEPGVLSALFEAIDHLKSCGVEFKEVSLPSIRHGVSTYYIIAPAEASSNLARFDGIRYGLREEGQGHIDVVANTRGRLFGHEVKQRIMTGTYVLSAGYYEAYYMRAQRIRALMTQEFEDALKDFDAIFSPTSPVVAFEIGSLSKDPLALKLLDYCTIPANMGGFPAISIPGGYSEGLPIGIQILGSHQSDEKVLQIAYTLEQELGSWRPTQMPPEL